MALKRLYEKNELAFSLVWIVAYVVLMSLADSLSSLVGVEKSVTLPVSLVLAIALIIWIKRMALTEKYGLTPGRFPFKAYLGFIPLAIINIVFLLKSKQTIIIKNNKIVCKNIFGKIIDEIEFVNVKLAYTQNICVFSVKMHHIYRPFIITIMLFCYFCIILFFVFVLLLLYLSLGNLLYISI